MRNDRFSSYVAGLVIMAGMLVLFGCKNQITLAPQAVPTPTPTITQTPLPSPTPTPTQTPLPTPWIVEGTAENFDQEVFDCPIPVLVEFYATWCPHCQDMAPAIVLFAAEHAGECKVVQVDVDLEPGLVAEYGVTGYPTCIFFVDGVEITRFSGSYPTTQDNLDLLNIYFDSLFD